MIRTFVVGDVGCMEEKERERMNEKERENRKEAKERERWIERGEMRK